MRRGVLVAAAVLLCFACKRGANEVVVYTSVDQPFSEPIFKEFEKRSGMKVLAVYDTEETKSTGVVNRLIAEARQPQADVFLSGDPVRPFLLIKRGLVQPYPSPAAATVPARFRAPDGTWTGSAARARILLVNKEKVSAAEMPKSVRDLAAPRWKGQTALANPLFGTTTMHVAALFGAWGDEKGRAFLDDLRTNQTRIASSNGEVKRLVVAGEVVFGLCDTDDAAEALHDGAPVEVVYPDQDGIGTLVMPTWLVLLRSCALAAAVTACALLLGVPLGLLLGRADIPGSSAALLLHALPMFVPPFLLALGWFYLPHPDALFTPAGAIVVEAIAFTPIVTALVALGVQAIDPSMEEAGRLSAPPWKVAFRIILPVTWPAAALGALLVFALSLSALGLPMFLS